MMGHGTALDVHLGGIAVGGAVATAEDITDIASANVCSSSGRIDGNIYLTSDITGLIVTAEDAVNNTAGNGQVDVTGHVGFVGTTIDNTDTFQFVAVTFTGGGSH